MILYINSCVRKESRTNRIAKALIEKLGDEFLRLNATLNCTVAFTLRIY